MKNRGTVLLRWIFLPAAAAVAFSALAGADAWSLLEAGKRIYNEGILPDGTPVEAARAGMTFSGKTVACVVCHRRSGRGGWEGLAIIPPVTGPILFNLHKPAIARHRKVKGIEKQELSFADRPAYTDRTLLRAMREGVLPNGNRFTELMPRYRLDDEAGSALAIYLRSLPGPMGPGVADHVFDVATVITPQAGEAARKAFDSVIGDCLPKPQTGSVHPGRHMNPVTVNLHRWEVTGDPATWEGQLDALYARQPVFAMLSGLGGGEWAPVHRFCERTATPCLFPNVDAPPAGAGGDFYSFYLSGGVLLESRVLAKHLGQMATRPGRVIQVHREAGSIAGAAHALADALSESGIRVESRVLPPGGAVREALASALAGTNSDDVVVLWLRDTDLAVLPSLPPAAGAVFASATLGNMQRAPLPEAWKPKSHLIYPFELPQRRKRDVFVDLKLWFGARQIPLTDERLQVDTLTACLMLERNLGPMRGYPQRDLLVEWVEDTMIYSFPYSNYPNISLGRNQRTASKGAYIVRFDDKVSGGVEAETEWLVP